MSFLRWAPTILGFPLGGWLAMQLVGSVTNPVTAALAGAVAGAVLGAAQWIALGRRADWLWLAASILGMAAGAAFAAVVTGAATTTPALIVTGLVTGAVVGASQGTSLRRGWRISAVWAATVGLAWAAGWAITANVIVDIESGFATFGLSGALLVTIITGLVLRRILGPVAHAAPVPVQAIPEVVR